jgi:hypothetical protein
MRVRLTKPWRQFKVGHEMDVADGVAELWKLQRRAVEVEVTSEPERMVPTPRLEVTTRKPRGRKPRAEKVTA